MHLPCRSAKLGPLVLLPRLYTNGTPFLFLGSHIIFLEVINEIFTIIAPINATDLNKADLLVKLGKVEKLATISKLNRALANPLKYVYAIGFRELVYKRKGFGKNLQTTTFFDQAMHIQLPSSTDIYLTGGKSHDSEIRLAKFLIDNLNPGNTFADVGAHYGYFTLLAARLVGDQGTVLAFEASTNNFSILQKNTASASNIRIINKAVSDEDGKIEFYQFPNLYSEFNSINKSQFEKEKWFQKLQPDKLVVDCITLGPWLTKENIDPKVIKIDVEGAELKVIVGLKKMLDHHAPMIVMEYLSKERGNTEHQAAAEILRTAGLKSHRIDRNGALIDCPDIDAFMNAEQIDSDNFVFKR